MTNEEFGTEIKFGFVKDHAVGDGFYQYVDYYYNKNDKGYGYACLNVTNGYPHAWKKGNRKSPFELSYHVSKHYLTEIDCPAMKILYGIL